MSLMPELDSPWPVCSGILGVNTWIVPSGPESVFVVDPAACALSGDGRAVTGFLESRGLECVAVLLTHTHFDHITGISAVKAEFPDAVLAVHEAECGELGCVGPMNRHLLGLFRLGHLSRTVSEQPLPDVVFRGGENLGSVVRSADSGVAGALSEWRIIHTPGHSPGSVCFYNGSRGWLISGDTLFFGTYGRTDMYGGDRRAMGRSLGLLAKTVRPGSRVYPGHDDWGFVMEENVLI